MFCKLLHPCFIVSSTEGYQIIYYFSQLNSLMQFYYVQDGYQKNQLGTRLDKRQT